MRCHFPSSSSDSASVKFSSFNIQICTKFFIFEFVQSEMKYCCQSPIKNLSFIKEIFNGLNIKFESFICNIVVITHDPEPIKFNYKHSFHLTLVSLQESGHSRHNNVFLILNALTKGTPIQFNAHNKTIKLINNNIKMSIFCCWTVFKIW